MKVRDKKLIACLCSDCFIIYFGLIILHFYHAKVNALPSAVYFLIFSSSFIYMFFKIKSKTDTRAALLCCMIYSAPISFFHVWGSQGFISFFLFFNVLFIFNNLKSQNPIASKYSSFFFMLFIMIFYTFIPLIKSASFFNGINTFFKYQLLVISIISSLFCSESIDNNNAKIIKSVLIKMSLGLSFAAAIQLFLAHVLGLSDYMRAVGGERKIVSLWFLDFSSNSMYLIIGAVVLFAKENKKIKDWLVIIFCFGTLSLTSTRSALYSGIIVLGLIVLFTPSKRKLLEIVLLGCFALFSLYLLSLVRGGGDVDELINDTGRFDLIKHSLDYFLRHPFGTGFDWTPIENDYGMIVHVFFLLILNMGGILYALLAFLIFVKIAIIVYEKKLMQEFWTWMFILIVGLFIPDLTGNLIVIVVACFVILFKPPRRMLLKTD